MQETRKDSESKVNLQMKSNVIYNLTTALVHQSQNNQISVYQSILDKSAWQDHCLKKACQEGNEEEASPETSFDAKKKEQRRVSM